MAIRRRERRLVKEKYERIRRLTNLPPLEKLENILSAKYLDPETFEVDLKRDLWRYYNHLLIELSSFLAPDNFIAEIRSLSIKNTIKKKIADFLKDAIKTQSILVKKDLEGNFIEVIKTLWENIKEGLDLYTKALSSIDISKVSIVLKEPMSVFEKIRKNIPDFPKSIEEFEDEFGVRIEDYEDLEREITEILFSTIHNYLSFILEKITGESELLIAYVESKELPREKREELVNFVKEIMVDYYNAYLKYLDKKYLDAIKILWRAYKKLKEKVQETIKLLQEIWRNYKLKEYGERREKEKYIL